MKSRVLLLLIALPGCVMFSLGVASPNALERSAAQQKPAPSAPTSQASPTPASAPSGDKSDVITMQTPIKVDVPIVTVDVVVKDKKGKPVKDLAKSDFRVFENGVAQEILNFQLFTGDDPVEQLASITTDRPIAPEQQQYILFLFDRTSLEPGTQEQANRAAAKFIEENMGPVDLVAIASYRSSMQILQNFTANKRRLAQALGVVSNSQTGDPSDTRPDPVGSPSVGTARQNLQTLSNGFSARNLMIAVRGLFNSLRAIKGRKSLVVFSGGVTLSQDNSIDLYSAIDAANKSNVTVYTIDAKGLSVDIPSPALPGRRSSLDSQPRWGSLGAFVNSFQGRTPPPSGGGGSTGGGGGTTGGTPGGTPGGSVPGGLPGGTFGGTTGGTRGGTPGGTPGGSFPGNNPSGFGNDPFGSRSRPGGDRPLDQLSIQEMKDVLLTMATETGGFYIRNSNDFERGLKDIQSEMRNYYSLGYESSNKLHNGKFRPIKVEVTRKGLNVKFRKGYFDQKPLDALAGTPAEKPLTKAIEATAPISDLPLRFVSDYFYEGPQLARAPVAIQVPISKLQFKKDRDLRNASVDVLGVAFREDGTVAARFSDTISFNFTADRLKTLPPEATMTFPNYFKLPPGKYRLKIAVHDRSDLVGTAEQSAEIPPFPAGQLTTSSLVLGDEVRPVSSLISNLESQLMDEKNPLIFNGMKIYQSVQKRFSKDASMAVYCNLYNMTVDAKKNQPHLLISYSILSDNKLLYQHPLTEFADVPRMENGASPMGMLIPLKDLAAGHYTFQLLLRDGVTNANRFLRKEFDIEEPPSKP